MFKRKIYDELVEWKSKFGPKYATMIEGPRRVGKSTVAEEFAKNEFKSYIKIDFANITKRMEDVFTDLADLGTFFRRLQLETGVVLYKGESVIIFDEIQKAPLVRQAIKHLVADGKYYYIETGSLISIKKNVKDMLMNVPRVNPDYGKDMDKDLFNARDNALTEQLNKDFPRNNPYRNINPDEGLNMPKPEINREKSQNINEQLKKLRERVGN